MLLLFQKRRAQIDKLRLGQVEGDCLGGGCELKNKGSGNIIWHWILIVFFGRTVELKSWKKTFTQSWVYGPNSKFLDLQKRQRMVHKLGASSAITDRIVQIGRFLQSRFVKILQSFHRVQEVEIVFWKWHSRSLGVTAKEYGASNRDIQRRMDKIEIFPTALLSSLFKFNKMIFPDFFARDDWSLLIECLVC